MVDCGDLGTCLIPMWVQYALLAIMCIPFLVKAFSKRDPYDRM